MAVTCKQIAEMVGVSRQAAASVLNHAEVCLVSPEKRDRILKLAQELHYVSSNVARTLVRGRSGMIGILTGGLHVYRVYSNLIMLDGSLREAGYLPIMVYTRSEFDAVADGIRSLVRQGVDGLFILGLPPSVAEPLFAQRLHELIPTVFLDLDFVPEQGVHYVNFDYRAACEEMAHGFLRQSVRRAHAFFYDPRENWATPCQAELLRLRKKRLLSFSFSAVIHRTDVLHPEKEIDARSRFADVFAELRAMKEPPELLIFEDTPCAMAALPVLAERGWKVPEQVRVFSFTAGRMQDSCLPVSSIQPDFRAFAAAAARVMEKAMHQPHGESVFETVPARFIFRGEALEDKR